jgi:UDP-N-acetylmuramate--alanine ligase
MESFSGVKRRLEFYVKQPDRVYFDDYAHHPREIAAAISSVKRIYPERHLTAIFQPHLYTRTRDFAEGFAEALSAADRVILIPIYPAREEPIEGVSSKLILDGVTAEKYLVEKSELCDLLGSLESDVVGTFGAGDIELLCQDVNQVIANK